MEFTWLDIVFYLLLIDSIGAVVVAWCGERWYGQYFSPLTRYFPVAKGWALYYLILVLFIGYLAGSLPF